MDPRRIVSRFAAAAVFVLVGGTADGQVAIPALAPLDSIVVTGTRVGRQSFDLPMSIDAVDASAIRNGGPQVNLSESLQRVPGINVQNRQNYAQDLQISSRGFGARSTFGVRGIKLFTDGIPASMPDGQGQVSHFALGSAERIEVLRGPFAMSYGNAAGGVIQIFTEEGGPEAKVSGGLAVGSRATSRTSAKVSGQAANVSYVAEGSHFETDGWRPHSAAERDAANAKFKWSTEGGTRVTVIGNWMDLRNADDPLGLSRAEYTADPRATTPSAVQFDTRKTIKQAQAGVVLEHDLTAGHTLHFMVYDGTRTVRQYQSIPVASQLAATSPGGVIDFDRGYGGLDARYVWRTSVAGHALTALAGVDADQLNEHRLGYQNFIGSATGILGALRRNEDNLVRNLDYYATGELAVTAALTLTAGVRTSEVRFRSLDHYIVAGNPDDSGNVNYRKTTPAVGATFKLTPSLNAYAAWGRGFETPTLNELAYRPSGQTGLNFALKPSTSDNAELGLKWRVQDARANLAVFDSHTEDELAVLSNTGGRSTFQNVGATRRRGAELALQWAFARSLQLNLAASYIDARYLDAFLTCVGTPCTRPTTPVPAGNHLPAAPQSSAYGELVWFASPNWSAAFEAKYQAKLYVDDVNSDAAAAYALANARASYEWQKGKLRVQVTARVDNLFDKRYVATVIVNEGNARFFEPAPGRAWLVAINAEYTF